MRKSSVVRTLCLLSFVSVLCLLYYWEFMTPKDDGRHETQTTGEGRTGKLGFSSGGNTSQNTQGLNSLLSHRASKTTHQKQLYPPTQPSYVGLQSTTSSIPRILHQLWKTKHVHTSMSDWITSWSQHNPGWTRVLWTHESLNKLVASEFPEHFPMFVDYRENISRADAARYFILYRYGGIYADLDLECLRPLEDILVSSPCILTEEASAVATLVWDRTRAFTGNTFIACRRQHPFLKMVLDELHVSKDIPNILQSTGPLLLNKIRLRYTSILDRPKDIVVLPSPFFLPTYDQKHHEFIVNRCVEMLKPNRTMLPGSPEVLRAQIEDCNSLAKRDFANVPFPESYSVHHWVHTYRNYAKYSGSPSKWTVPYEQLVPNVTLGEDFVDQYKT